MSKEYSFASPNRKFIYRGEIRPDLENLIQIL